MSSFPHFLKSTKSTYLKPKKQGGRFKLDLYGEPNPQMNYKENLDTDFMSLPPQKQKQGGIDCQQKEKKKQKQFRTYSLANVAKKYIPSEKVVKKLSIKIPPFKRSIFQIKKDLAKNKYMTEPSLQSELSQFDQQQVHHPIKGQKCVFARINQCLDESFRLEQKLFECIIITSDARADILRFHDEVDRVMADLKQSMQESFDILRKAISKNKKQASQQIKRSHKDLIDNEVVYSNIRTAIDFMSNKTAKMEKMLGN